MPNFSRESKQALSTCHGVLRTIARLAIKFIDFKVLECHREQSRQDTLYQDRKTKVEWPNSQHNKSPSMAMDFAPWPIDWSDNARFYYVSGILMGIGELFLWITGLNKKYYLRYGGDWDRDGEVEDESFKDLGHIELRRRD